MAVVISAAMAPIPPNCTPPSLHGSSRLSRASSSGGASMPPPALPKKEDTLFTEEELQALMSGQCELLSFSEHHHLQPSSPSPSSLLCRDDDDDRWLHLQEPPPPPPPFAGLDGLIEEPISDEDMDMLAPLFCDEEIMALCTATSQQQQQQQAPMHFSSRPRSDDPQGHVSKKRLSPPWPSCIADDNDDEVEQAGPPPSPSPSPPPTKKARTTKTKSTGGSWRREHSPSPPPIKKKARRTQTTKRRSSRPEHAAARAERLRRNLRKWQNMISTRVLTRQFGAPELSRGRTALRCQCTELAGFGGGGCACALHQEDAMPEDSRAWMFSAAQGQGRHVPLVGGPGRVLVPAISAGNSKAVVLQYQRWRRSVSMPSRFYVQHAVEKKASSARWSEATR